MSVTDTRSIVNGCMLSLVEPGPLLTALRYSQRTENNTGTTNTDGADRQEIFFGQISRPFDTLEKIHTQSTTFQRIRDDFMETHNALISSFKTLSIWIEYFNNTNSDDVNLNNSIDLKKLYKKNKKCINRGHRYICDISNGIMEFKSVYEFICEMTPDIHKSKYHRVKRTYQKTIFALNLQIIGSSKRLIELEDIMYNLIKSNYLLVKKIMIWADPSIQTLINDIFP